MTNWMQQIGRDIRKRDNKVYQSWRDNLPEEVLASFADPFEAFLSNCAQDGIDPQTGKPYPPETFDTAEYEGND